MATAEFDLLRAIETHFVAEIRAILDNGFDIAPRVKGKSLVKIT